MIRSLIDYWINMNQAAGYAPPTTEVAGIRYPCAPAGLEGYGHQRRRIRRQAQSDQSAEAAPSAGLLPCRRSDRPECTGTAVRQRTPASRGTGPICPGAGAGGHRLIHGGRGLLGRQAVQRICFSPIKSCYLWQTACTREVMAFRPVSSSLI